MLLSLNTPRAPTPPNFYPYLQAMEAACKKLVGEHDFRNFCKMDAANVHNYKRHIISFEICSSIERFDQL